VPQLPDHSDRPEVVRARSGQIGKSIRYSHTQHTEFLYLAVQTDKIKGVAPGFLRLARPYTQVESLLHSIHLKMLLAAFLVLAASVLLSWLLSRRIVLQIFGLSQGLKRLGRGKDYEQLNPDTSQELRPIVAGVNKLIKRVDQDLRTISRQRDELETVLDSLGEGVMLLDVHKRVRHANRVLEEMSFIPGSPVGRRPLELFRSLQIEAALDRYLVDGLQEPVEFRIKIHKDRYFQVRIAPVQSHQTAAAQFIVVLREITEKRRLEKMRKDFVANVSHELKTPLTSIKGYAETALETAGGENARIRQFLEIILKNVEKMNNLIQDLLGLARLESLQNERKSEPVSLLEAVNRAWEVCAPLARDKQVSLDLDLPEPDIEVRFDPDQLVRVLVNLIENALKYGPRGQRISIRARESERQWLVSVENQGPLIPESIQGRIFERFFTARAEGAESGQPGSGLGLSICKHILENRGGRIWVQSPVPGREEGSVFSFSIPRDRRE
ncbi:MAG: sensor histidine kinase, partial [Thermodesulfobacteriota bacterium]